MQRKMSMRKRLLALLFVAIVAACSRDNELTETLAWMDNTYNPHKDVFDAYGHGHTGWYAPNNSNPYDEVLVSGSTETFTYDGCQMTLRIEDDPAAEALRDVHSTRSYTFNLRDINPQSIKITPYTRRGGFRCDTAPEADCDHAEITFFTRNEAPLIDEDGHTIFLKLQGSDHESKSKQKGEQGYFEVSEVEYANRFAKAFRHAVELCGGKPEPFQ